MLSTNIAFVVAEGFFSAKFSAVPDDCILLEQVRSRHISTMRILHNPAVQTDSAPNTDSEAGTAISITIDPGSTSMGRDFSRLFSDIVCEQARQYMNSYPGNHAWGCNTPHHTRFANLARGIVHFEGSLGHDSDVLCYRLSMTKLATDIKNYLDLPIADAHLFDIWAWHLKQEPNEQWDRFSRIHEAVHTAPVFGYPEPEQGLFFNKPFHYLAIAFVKSGRSMEQVHADIENLIDRKSPTLIFFI